MNRAVLPACVFLFFCILPSVPAEENAIEADWTILSEVKPFNAMTVLSSDPTKKYIPCYLKCFKDGFVTRYTFSKEHFFIRQELPIADFRKIHIKKDIASGRSKTVIADLIATRFTGNFSSRSSADEVLLLKNICVFLSSNPDVAKEYSLGATIKAMRSVEKMMKSRNPKDKRSAKIRFEFAKLFNRSALQRALFIFVSFPVASRSAREKEKQQLNERQSKLKGTRERLRDPVKRELQHIIKLLELIAELEKQAEEIDAFFASLPDSGKQLRTILQFDNSKQYEEYSKRITDFLNPFRKNGNERNKPPRRPADRN